MKVMNTLHESFEFTDSMYRVLPAMILIRFNNRKKPKNTYVRCENEGENYDVNENIM
jgi:hypothetical protein